MRLLLTVFAAIVAPSRRPSIFLRVGNVDDSSTGTENITGSSIISADKSTKSGGALAGHSESTIADSDLTEAKPLSAVLTHTTADFDSLASAVGLAKVRVHLIELHN